MFATIVVHIYLQLFQNNAAVLGTSDTEKTHTIENTIEISEDVSTPTPTEANAQGKAKTPTPTETRSNQPTIVVSDDCEEVTVVVEGNDENTNNSVSIDQKCTTTKDSTHNSAQIENNVSVESNTGNGGDSSININIHNDVNN